MADAKQVPTPTAALPASAAPSAAPPAPDARSSRAAAGTLPIAGEIENFQHVGRFLQCCRGGRMHGPHKLTAGEATGWMMAEQAISEHIRTLKLLRVKVTK